MIIKYLNVTYDGKIMIFFDFKLDFYDKSPKRKICDDKYMSWLDYLLLILD